MGSRQRRLRGQHPVNCREQGQAQTMDNMKLFWCHVHSQMLNGLNFSVSSHASGKRCD